MEIVLILFIALLLDLTLGEPPNAVHPVAWMGKVIAFLIQVGKGRSPTVQFIWGSAVVLLTLGIFVTSVWFLLVYLKGFNLIACVVVSAVIFKTAFSLSGLRQTASKIKVLLSEEKLDEARFELRALVGRDTANLDKSQIVSATVESLAENSCDSFFAPLFYFAFLGVPGAIGYRVINTLDAMIGHHGEYEYLGKAAARLDTVVNFIPARIAALAIVLASWLCRDKAGASWRTMRRDAGNTASPNAGWTMSAMAGALGVQLEKVGYYKLGDKANLVLTGHIDASQKIIMVAALVWSLIIILAEVIYYAAA
jgi:adenosylcobinamide-phosphate synthase